MAPETVTMKHHLKYGMSTNAVHAGETRFNE
jgi:hypothetical protein